MDRWFSDCLLDAGQVKRAVLTKSNGPPGAGSIEKARQLGLGPRVGRIPPHKIERKQMVMGNYMTYLANYSCFYMVYLPFDKRILDENTKISLERWERWDQMANTR